MGTPENGHEPGAKVSEPRSTAPSDLIGVRLTLGVGIAIVVVLAAFFFVGPVAGIVVLLAAAAIAITAAVAAIRRAEVHD